ncbi:unnamed protein product, partial [marine sediment metagenome]
MVAQGHSLKKRESYLVSRISKKDFRALKRIGYTRYEQRDTRMVMEEIVLRYYLTLEEIGMSVSVWEIPAIFRTFALRISATLSAAGL